MDVSSPEPDLLKELKSPKPRWSQILKRVREHPSEVRYIDPSTGLTALHVAVERRSTSQARLQAVAAMLACYPGAATLRCRQRGHTPLDRAATARTDHEAILECDARVTELLVRSLPLVELVDSRSNPERLAPLALHVQHMSQVRARVPPRQTDVADDDPKQLRPAARVSRAVLGALAPHCSLDTLSEALETLYACNSLTIMDMIGQEDRRGRRHGRLDYQNPSRGRSSTAGHWIWEWLLDILAVLHARTTGVEAAGEQQSPFRALHLLSRLPHCPPPFLLLAIRAYPYDLQTPDAGRGNLPLHGVAAWPASDVASRVRKYLCLEALAAAHEDGLLQANAAGHTPVDLDRAAGSNLLEMGVSGHDRKGRFDEVSREFGELGDHGSQDADAFVE